jgi:hypothetical protein
MSVSTARSNRTRLDTVYASELARHIRGGRSDQVSIEALLGSRGKADGGQAASSAIILDGFRSRPHYFDGRLLTGKDLTRDQDYARQRQSDMARAAGFGVVEGLGVSRTDLPGGGDALLIKPGHGLTPGGELVVIERELTVRIADLPAVRELDSRFGIRIEAAQPIDKRQGLFIVALRAVEFTANPVTAYPTSITGARGLQDGDIIEATAVTLTPYAAPQGAVSLDDMRGAAARDIFTGAGRQGLLQDALPIAMVALEYGAVRWLDIHMVRRETGADTPLQVSIGGQPRAQAEAHMLQYAGHLAAVMALGNTAGIAAVKYFSALPAAGQLPLAAVTIDAFGFLQSFFPPGVQTDFSFVPADELATLVEESLALPPLDLTASAEELQGTGVVILMPVQREQLAAIRAALPAEAPLPPERPLLASAGKSPGLLLSDLMIRRNIKPRPLAPAAPADAFSGIKTAWKMASDNLAARRDESADMLWYVRRRTVPYRASLTGRSQSVLGVPAVPVIPVQPPPAPTPADVPRFTTSAELQQKWMELRISEVDAKERVQKIFDQAPAGPDAIRALLTNPLALRTRPVFALLIRVLARDTPSFGPEAIAEIIGKHLSSDAGAGFLKLQVAAANEEIAGKICIMLAEADLTSAVDQWLNSRPTITAVDAKKIMQALRSGNKDTISRLIGS